MIEFIGRFHPVLVHLPIGILLIAVLFQFLSRKEKYELLDAAVVIALFWGMLSAVASCISGFLLSRSDDYDESLISKHQWFGIAVAVVSVVAYFFKKKNNKYVTPMMTLMSLLIIITGHLGGSITHGSDYLTKVFSGGDNETANAKRKPVPDAQEAFIYADIVKPVLETRCYNCHGPNKQKGKLRLDAPNFILKGGKDGEIITAGKPDESELIKRILLPKESKDHMPPIEKPQLSKQDLYLLHWWVSTGADFTKKVKELPQTEKIKPALLALQSGEVKDETKLSDIPAKPVEKADGKIIRQLIERGVAVMPVAKNSNYLSANFVAVDSVTEKDLQLLLPLKKQLIRLKLGHSEITDADLKIIAELTALTALSIERTGVTDNGIQFLRNLLQLQYLNLTGTKATAKGLESLKDLKNLRQVYLYQTAVKGSDWGYLKKIFPQTIIDTGGYKLPLLESDTSELKAARVK